MHYHFQWNVYISIVSLILIGLYIAGVIRSNNKYKKWPIKRTFYWGLGILSITIALLGPMQQHHDFVMHMYAHLLIGMISPLAFALSHPLTLLLRNLSITQGRKLTSILKFKYFQFITHPVVAMILNIGGLWILYTSSLFHLMHDYLIVNLLVHIHIFLAGYVFTISILSIPPLYNRKSFKMRSIVLIIYMALHSILAKWLYANPPIEDTISVQKGAMLMYYGGDFVDVFIVILLFYGYYKPAKRVVVQT